MSQSSALRFDDLSEASASISDALPIVRARFVEAADTIFHLDVGKLRPSAVRSFWPDIQPEPMDRVDILIRYRPSAAAISRAEEVMYGWLLDYVEEEESRVVIGKWSMCLAAPHVAGSFRQFCQKTSRVRRTAERLLSREFQRIASETIKIPQSLQEPNWSRVSPMMPNSDTDWDKFREPLPTSPHFGMVPGARPVHDPASPELQDLIKRLEKANARRERARRKRKA